MRPYRRGLIVGKFAPLHRGHDLLISRARASCDELIVFSYSEPEFAECPPARRRAWLQALYPDVTSHVFSAAEPLTDLPPLPRNSDSWDSHRHFVARAYLALVAKPLDAVFTSEDYGDGFAQVLSDTFIAHGLQTTRVAHVEVDRARRQVPVSATQIRADVHRYRDVLPPRVYADFVQTVCLIGGESTGKSTLAERLAREHDTVFVSEFGRSLWEQHGGKLRREDFLTIATTQIANEEAAKLQARRFLFADTSPLTTLFYSQDRYSETDEQLVRLSHRAYDHWFLCAPDFEFVQDGTRRDAEFARRQHQWYLDVFAQRRIRFSLLTGSIEARVQQANRVLLARQRPCA